MKAHGARWKLTTFISRTKEHEFNVVQIPPCLQYRLHSFRAVSLDETFFPIELDQLKVRIANSLATTWYCPNSPSIYVEHMRNACFKKPTIYARHIPT